MQNRGMKVYREVGGEEVEDRRPVVGRVTKWRDEEGEDGVREVKMERGKSICRQTQAKASIGSQVQTEK